MTFNRRAVLAQTLARLPDLMAGDGLAPTQWEAVVADNGSSDGTGVWLAGAAAEPGSRVVPLILGENLGCGARNAGVERARGEIVVFLDDDSWPRPGAVAAALDRLAAEPGLAVLGGAGFSAGRGQDAAALPLVPPGCGLVVTREVFRAVGGFDAGFVYRAEEYELVFRVLAAGHGVARDVAVVAVVDDHPAFAGMWYRGVPVMRLAEAEVLGFDGWVVTNRNPAQAPGLAASVAGDGRPVWALAESWGGAERSVKNGRKPL